MPAFGLVAAALAITTGPTSARPAARTAPPIHVFMRTMSSCERSSGRAHQPRKTGPRLADLSQLTHTQAAGITSGASGDDDADDNPSGGGGANGGGGASALGW